MKVVRYVKTALIVLILLGVGITGYLTRDRWLDEFLSHTPLGYKKEPAEDESKESTDSGTEPAAPTGKIIVNEQAQDNLGLTAKVLKAQTFWKTIEVPGMVVDRAGMSDRGVVAPATGVVARISHFPGDLVRSGELLFRLKLLSESLHQTQADLFKATQDITLAAAQRKRLADAAGAVPEAKLIEVDNQVTRLEVAAKAYRQELLNRGFSPEMIDGVASGKFVNEINITVPFRGFVGKSVDDLGKVAANQPKETPLTFEVQELKVDLGQQVQAGQALCTLANHQLLAIEGRAFRDETPLLERTVKEKWPVEVDFQEQAGSDWGELKQTFRIRQLSNTIDAQTRTFAFLIPLDNESRMVEDNGRSQTLWRFRPGQRVRLRVRVEELKNVFVLPADAVTRDGPESFIFTQNVNTFIRKPVRVLLHEGRQVVIVNDGSLPAGTFAVQSAAAQLNRMVKAGGGSGVPKGYHIHADGSLHKNEDEEK